ncbi:TetR/AcrR family transcriptional regulator [Pseudoclavibacter chungangensis]|uniref:TetR/AcrR family transcriptional regulator n=1 Tax=Pseudoclavibacter chungangensis TaxID=587635 RepID=A0A7J5BP03_9MICO|nr:TetR/AcrR family transcriptional regulator [Pseudoclavibacter chungangensis]KAB1654293.1 TetR/AcrR family transcriptional regulator [Pseudoclavibacter chungangensis]NYJ65301.1 AcrR family transcriptional regulator [Pseudoclavibacter chungangensis]
MRADARANRQELIEAGRRAIAERGTAFSLRTVAQDAGVGIATLYRHFPTRDDLVLGVVDEAWARIDEVVDRHEAEWADDPASAWRSTIQEVAALEIGALAEQIAPFAASETVTAAATLRQLGRETRLAPVLERARAADLLSPDVDAASLVVAIASLSRPLPEHITTILPDHRAWLVDTFVRGLAVDRASNTDA